MSGRLVILRHKSWNVWNREPRERVLRDERLHREKVDKEKETEKARERELKLETIKQQSQSQSQETAVTATAVVHLGSEEEAAPTKKPEAPFRLFEDLEQKALMANLGQNVDYVKEQQAKELREQKKLGIAPFKLGDPEQFDRNPWYSRSAGSANTQDNKQHHNNGSSAVRKAAKQSSWKSVLDPMTPFVRYAHDDGSVTAPALLAADKQPKESCSVESHSSSHSGSDSSGSSDEADSDSSRRHRKRHHKHKRHSKKEHKRKRIHKEDDRGRDRHKKSNYGEKAEKDASDKLLFERLRQKRLERERMEHKKALALLL